ncbi:DnaJ domain-containing protein [Mucilaginibacter sp. RS28]|uniref:DnaJ domain-containing protein n=1 Tax=Mucilaginibacter straminoryzae TaxID=2932774 RepID=A0A9X2BAG5_9SPHI|nr:DnaJ domain-containing protein [Mucilaginibacter straminoryzae]MCJ8211814.1 DnaJ domain-containing protein [Mucilaginibacter straminoryzae]
MMKDLYYILGIPGNATPSQIKDAHVTLSNRFKPETDQYDYILDRHLKELNEAYEILSDPIRRRRYDRALKRSQQRRIALFKTRTINVAVTLALVAITAIFGAYVYKVLRKPAPVQTPPVIAKVEPVVKHNKPHKRKHRKALDIASAERKSTKPTPETADEVKTEQPPAEPAQVPTAKAATVPATVEKPTAKTDAPLRLVKRVEPLPTSTYTTFLKPNLTGTVYLHQQADYMSAVVTVLPKNAKVSVLEEGQNFCKIAFNNYTGYVPRWTLNGL